MALAVEVSKHESKAENKYFTIHVSLSINFNFQQLYYEELESKKKRIWANMQHFIVKWFRNQGKSDDSHVEKSGFSRYEKLFFSVSESVSIINEEL